MSIIRVKIEVEVVEGEVRMDSPSGIFVRVGERRGVWLRVGVGRKSRRRMRRRLGCREEVPGEFVCDPMS